MAVNNKFKVYGQIPSVDNVFDPDSEEYTSLYNKGIVPNSLARSQDVLTPLRETTVVAVALLNWLANHNFSDIVDFEDPEVFSDTKITETKLKEMLENIQDALEQAIDDQVASKEPVIEKNNTTKKGFLKYNGADWYWDQSSYQTSATILSSITSFYGLSSNKGFMYKSSGSSSLKNTGNKQFVYFDSEESDSNGNLILNLKTFNYD